MALLIVLTMSHPHVGFYSKINICFYAKFYGQSFGMQKTNPQPAGHSPVSETKMLGSYTDIVSDSQSTENIF